MEVPGVGPLLASALVATIADPKSFKSGRNLAAWIGFVPRQNSSGGKERLGSITKRGDRYLRQMLFIGALAVIRYAQRHGSRRRWIVQLLSCRTTKIAAVALANQMARMIWAIMTTGERYCPQSGAHRISVSAAIVGWYFGAGKGIEPLDPRLDSVFRPALCPCGALSSLIFWQRSAHHGRPSARL